MSDNGYRIALKKAIKAAKARKVDMFVVHEIDQTDGRQYWATDDFGLNTSFDGAPVVTCVLCDGTIEHVEY